MSTHTSSVPSLKPGAQLSSLEGRRADELAGEVIAKHLGKVNEDKDVIISFPALAVFSGCKLSVYITIEDEMRGTIDRLIFEGDTTSLCLLCVHLHALMTARCPA